MKAKYSSRLVLRGQKTSPTHPSGCITVPTVALWWLQVHHIHLCVVYAMIDDTQHLISVNCTNKGTDMVTDDLLERIARAAYEANRSYCRAIDDSIPVPWEYNSQESKAGYKGAVASLLNNPGRTAAEQHTAWLEARTKDGWTYGRTKDIANKKHPNLLPYEALPRVQQYKDEIYRSIVLSFVK